MTPQPHTTSAETIKLDQALNAAIASVDSHRDPISRAIAASQVAERLQRAQMAVSQARSDAVASAVMLPGMSMAKVADELGVSKSMVAKLAGPAGARERIAADMRDRLVSSVPSPTSVSRLQAAFDDGADESRRRRR
jgi:DNA-binding NtrC family response regulator